MPVTSGVIYSRGSVLGATKVKSYNRFAALDNGVYTIDPELMNPMGGYLSDEPDDHFLAISSTGGNTILVSGTPGKSIEVHNYSIVATGATDVRFLSSTGTLIGGPFNLSNGTPVSLNGYSMVTNEGENLVITSIGPIVTGSLIYRLV